MSRKANAICEAINRRERRFAAWAKHDPTRTDLPVPQNIVSLFSEYEAPFKRCENHVHAIYRPSGDREATRYVLKAFLDLYFEEGGFVPLKKYESDYEEIRSEYFECLMPAIGEQEVAELLADRRFVVLEGPPGTGKTRMAVKLLSLPYDFGAPNGNRLALPKNLHILGTMNSADRSIAILDVAIRRRFAFVKLWPQFSVVQECGSKLSEEA